MIGNGLISPSRRSHRRNIGTVKHSLSRALRYQLAQAARRSLPESLLFAIARRESGFWPDARSRVGAAGLMQVNKNRGVR